MAAPSSPAGVDEGMRRLLAGRSAALHAGAKAVGWKIGINVPALQTHFGLDGPVVGYLTDRTVIPVGQVIDVSGWTRPALEVELAISVGEDGDVSGLAAAVELVDLDLPFDDIGPILAGNIFHRGVIFGPEHTDLAHADLEDADLADADLADADLEGVVTVAGQVVARGVVGEAPATTIRYVREFLADRGAVLAPGHRIIAGSVIAPMGIGPGDHIDVTLGPLGSIRVDVR